jgi:hypothetical protein
MSSVDEPTRLFNLKSPILRRLASLTLLPQVIRMK